jgi:hypothetical protein
MNAIRRHFGRIGRGQAMVETAIILPLLVLIIFFGIDFGRVFFGWVGLQNASRVAANYAGQHPCAWGDCTLEPADADEQAAYLAIVRSDARAIGCQPDPIVVPDPTFTDSDGTAVAEPEFGDVANVALECGFGMITPVISNLLGTVIQLHAESSFAVRTGEIDGPIRVPATPSPVPSSSDCEVPDMVGDRINVASTTWTAEGFSSANFTGVGSGNFTVAAQSIVAGAVIPCATTTITVWETAPTPSPTPIVPGATPTPVPTATPTPAPCLVPQFVGTQRSAAQATWTAAGFSTTVKFVPNANNWTVIQGQSQNSNALVACNSPISLYKNP